MAIRDVGDWSSVGGSFPPGVASAWSAPNQAPLGFLLSVAGSPVLVVAPATSTTQNYLFGLVIGLEPTGAAGYFLLQYGAFGTYTTFMYLSLLPTTPATVLTFGGVPLPMVGGVGAGLYVSSNVAAQPVIGGVTYSVG